MSEIQHRIHVSPAASPSVGPSAPANTKEQHQQVMGRAYNTPGPSSCFALLQPIAPLVCITSASCGCPLPPGAGFLCVLLGCITPSAITQNCKEEQVTWQDLGWGSPWFLVGKSVSSGHI